MVTDDIFKLDKKQGLLDSGPVQPPPVKAPTPVNPDLANGDLKIDDTGAFFTPKGQPVLPPVKNTVEGRLSGLLDSESPYIKASEAAAQRQANSRGLLNSSIAAGAGRKAAIESALPIAQQDAGFFQNSQLQKEQGDIQKGLYQVQGDISKELSAQGFQQDKALQDAENEFKKLDLTSRMQVEYDRMDEENKIRFQEITNDISQDYMKQYLAVLADPAFETRYDRQAAINVLNQTTADRFEIASAVAKIPLTWEPSRL